MNRIPLQQPPADTKGWRAEPAPRWWAARPVGATSLDHPTLASALEAAPHQGAES
jgi:hypothetical protein